jgi:hypothetical protein
MSVVVEELQITKEAAEGPIQTEMYRTFMVTGTDDPKEFWDHPDLPSRGNSYDDDNPYLIVQYRDVRKLDTKIWVIDITYSYPTGSISGWNFYGKVKVHFNVSSGSQHILTDVNGDLIGDASDKWAEYGTNVYIPTIEVTAELPVPTPFPDAQKAILLGYSHKTNRDEFLGANPGFILFSGIQATDISQQYGPDMYRIINRYIFGKITIKGQEGLKETMGIRYKPWWIYRFEKKTDDEGLKYTVRTPWALRWATVYEEDDLEGTFLGYGR